MENSKNISSTAFVVEVVKLEDDSRLFIVRTPQGAFVKVLNSANDVATFFNECQI